MIDVSVNMCEFPLIS